jgi:hypothetical protein
MRGRNTHSWTFSRRNAEVPGVGHSTGAFHD